MYMTSTLTRKLKSSVAVNGCADGRVELFTDHWRRRVCWDLIVHHHRCRSRPPLQRPRIGRGSLHSQRQRRAFVHTYGTVCVIGHARRRGGVLTSSPVCPTRSTSFGVVDCRIGQSSGRWRDPLHGDC